MKMNILLIEDEKLVIPGWKALLQDENDVGEVWAGTCWSEAKTLFEEHHPDITLVDMELRRPVGDLREPEDGGDVIEGLRHIRPHAIMIAVSKYTGIIPIRIALNAGAKSYVSKSAGKSVEHVFEELLVVIRSVFKGEKFIPADVQAVIDEFTPQGKNITEREIVVWKELRRRHGRGVNDIAKDLERGNATVRMQLRDLRGKLCAKKTDDIVPAGQYWDYYEALKRHALS